MVFGGSTVDVTKERITVVGCVKKNDYDMLEVSYGGFTMTNTPDFWDNISLTEMASVIIALCALGFTVWQGFRQRKHDRLSVKPHIDFYEKFSHTDDNLIYTLFVQNNGLGPAIIRSHRVYKRSGTNNENVEIENFEEELRNHLGYEISSIHTLDLHDDGGISANARHMLLAIHVKSLEHDGRARLKQRIYLGYVIEIEYESMYGETFIFSTDKYTKDFKFLKGLQIEK